MKPSKRDTTLSEKDALQDLLDTEKLLMGYYGTALLEGSSQAFRKTVFSEYGEAAKTQFRVFEQMLTRGFYEVQPAAKMLIDKQTETFSKAKKQISAS